jgi:tetratricopeptide (TPR) repeat protein
MSITRLLYRVFPFAAIVLLGALAYSNTLGFSFRFDDINNIQENTIIKDLGYFLSPSSAADVPLYERFRSRYVGYLSFALNYRLHGLDVRGYHIVNIAIHLINALLVYLLVMLTFRTPRMQDSALRESAGGIALLSALLFLCHPVQTQAVTYIVQRLASMAAMFYLVSLVFYVGSRLTDRRWGRIFMYAASIVSAAVAMKTKQIAFTLPVMIALYEYVFFEGRAAGRFLRLAPLFMTMLIVPISLIGAGGSIGEIVGEVDEATRAQETPRLEYLMTEFRVIVTYMRLILFPINQNLDYDYPMSHSFTEPRVIVSFVLIASVLGLVVYLLTISRSGGGRPAARLAAFGILWFFLALSVESSLIPLQAIFEHRVYLPSVGLAVAASAGAFVVRGRLEGGRAGGVMSALMVLVVLVLATATYVRNGVWSSELSLWSDVAAKSPMKARAHNNLGLAYYNEGNVAAGIDDLVEAVRLNPNYAEAHNNLGNAYLSREETDKAISHYKEAIRISPNYAEAYNNLGFAYEEKGHMDKAMNAYRTALKLAPDLFRPYNSLGLAYYNKGNIAKGMEHFLNAVRLNPNYAEAHNNLGLAYYNDGDTVKGIGHFLNAVRLNPNYDMALNNLGAAYLSMGQTRKAMEHFRQAIEINPYHAMAHNNMGIACMSSGLYGKAAEHFRTALSLKPDLENTRLNLERAYRKSKESAH